MSGDIDTTNDCPISAIPTEMGTATIRWSSVTGIVHTDDAVNVSFESGLVETFTFDDGLESIQFYREAHRMMIAAAKPRENGGERAGKRPTLVRLSDTCSIDPSKLTYIHVNDRDLHNPILHVGIGKASTLRAADGRAAVSHALCILEDVAPCIPHKKGGAQ